MSPSKALHLFDGCGLEIEYAIVDAKTLEIVPAADELIRSITGSFSNDADLDDIGWSNELVLHVLEIKMIAPSASLDGWDAKYSANIGRINELLRARGARLVPTGMHPWMNPASETVLWPHDYHEVYETFDRIFDCRRHGWANLQSCQINLPFSGDDEFGRLHAAVRFLLPIMPALTASTPFMDGRPTGMLDSRMEVYRTNSAKFPSITGKVIPEPVFTPAGYEEEVLGKIYQEIEPHDPDGTLRHEWLNARGAIARFDRSAIEIRVLDTQEYPGIDIAFADVITAALEALVSGEMRDYESQKAWKTEDLEVIFLRVIRDAEEAVIENPAYLEALGIGNHGSMTARDLWLSLVERFYKTRTSEAEKNRKLVSSILEKGCLARRILNAAGKDFSKENLRKIYLELCDCLENAAPFRL